MPSRPGSPLRGRRLSAKARMSPRRPVASWQSTVGPTSRTTGGQDNGERPMFHDAPVSRLAVQAEVLVIETEAFSFSPTEILPAARIVIAGAQGLYRNDVKVAAFRIESDDAQIFGLEGSSNGVQLASGRRVAAQRIGEALDITGAGHPGLRLRAEAAASEQLAFEGRKEDRLARFSPDRGRELALRSADRHVSRQDMCPGKNGASVPDMGCLRNVETGTSRLWHLYYALVD